MLEDASVHVGDVEAAIGACFRMYRSESFVARGDDGTNVRIRPQLGCEVLRSVNKVAVFDGVARWFTDEDIAFVCVSVYKRQFALPFSNIFC